MRPRTNLLSALLSAAGMLTLILDSRTALQGAAEGIELCIYTVVPSLLPFFVFAILLTSTLAGKEIKLLSPLGKACGIPKGAETLLLVGLLGGYPVGAQSVAQAYHDNLLTEQDAKRLLGFCSNAGPAFIFGIAGSLFSNQRQAWLLWAIHIASALIVGILLPGKNRSTSCKCAEQSMDLPKALMGAVRILSGVCGWIILFRVLIAFLNRWFLWLLPKTMQVAFIGMLELANGCHMLFSIQSESMRFILAAVILGFGGVCVGMQTISVTKGLGTGWYFPGKLLQGLFSLVLSLAIEFGISNAFFLIFSTIALLIFVFTVLLYSKRKKAVAISESIVYNN